MMQLTVAGDGKITLPVGLRDRNGFHPGTSIRVVESRSGLLLVPLKDGETAEDLSQELRDWQSLGAESWDAFPYEDGDE